MLFEITQFHLKKMFEKYLREINKQTNKLIIQNISNKIKLININIINTI